MNWYLTFGVQNPCPEFDEVALQKGGMSSRCCRCRSVSSSHGLAAAKSHDQYGPFQGPLPGQCVVHVRRAEEQKDPAAVVK